MSAKEVIHHHRIHHHRGRGNAERSRWRGQKRDWPSPPALREGGGESSLVRGGNAHTQPSEADAAGGAPSRLEASDDSDPPEKSAPSGGEGHKKRPAAHLEAEGLLPTAKASPDGAASDLPAGLTCFWPDRFGAGGGLGERPRRNGRRIAGRSVSSAGANGPAPTDLSKRKSVPTVGLGQEAQGRKCSSTGKGRRLKGTKLIWPGLKPDRQPYFGNQGETQGDCMLETLDQRRRLRCR